MRMDFTVVGAEVNLTARLEGLCGRLARELVVTGESACHLPGRFASLGPFRVRGMEGEVEDFGAP
jgi:adenylate cyclase